MKKKILSLLKRKILSLLKRKAFKSKIIFLFETFPFFEKKSRYLFAKVFGNESHNSPMSERSKWIYHELKKIKNENSN
tara:strand:+ start:8611 stop:8844 length:234 start_codon:yes stop_codon:yes gene_type:complete